MTTRSTTREFEAKAALVALICAMMLVFLPVIARADDAIDDQRDIAGASDGADDMLDGVRHLLAARLRPRLAAARHGPQFL